MPAKDGVRGEEGAKLLQQPAAKGLAFGGEASFLVGVEEQALAAQFLPQDAVFCPQVLDDFLLLPIHPAGNSHDDELPRCEGHGGGW
jgi:hypothetical protein